MQSIYKYDDQINEDKCNSFEASKDLFRSLSVCHKFTSRSRMVLTPCSKCLCLLREQHRFLIICSSSIKEEKEQHLVNDHVVLINETGTKEFNWGITRVF